MNQPLLEIRNVTYALDGKRILDSIDWRVDRGEHWVILGPNGAGKTTLLKMVCGYLWPNGGGEIYRKGKRLLNLVELRKSIGWVTSSLTAGVPGWENVLHTVLSGKFAQVGYWNAGRDRALRKDLAKAREILEESGCGELAEMEFGNLSQGEQQKVLIARARMTAPFLILLDEPCAGLDPQARETFLSWLHAFGSGKKTPGLIYVTHHLEEILPIFRQTLILKEGRRMACGTTVDLLRPATIKKLYGLSVRVVKNKGRYWPICTQ